MKTSHILVIIGLLGFGAYYINLKAEERMVERHTAVMEACHDYVVENARHTIQGDKISKRYKDLNTSFARRYHSKGLPDEYWIKEESWDKVSLSGRVGPYDRAECLYFTEALSYAEHCVQEGKCNEITLGGLVTARMNAQKKKLKEAADKTCKQLGQACYHR